MTFPSTLTVTRGLAIHQFDVTGHIQGTPTADGKLADGSMMCPEITLQTQQGGLVTVNGLTIVIPCNTIVQMPASSYAWRNFVDLGPLPDSTEIHVVGNFVPDANGVPRAVAGLVYIAQNSVTQGQGYITRIDYTTGAIFVGASKDGPDQVRLLINDPKGRYGRMQSPDERFQVDDQNPTIHAASGYPMCVPRMAPNLAATPPVDDALCPQENRPLVSAGCRTLQIAGVSPLPKNGDIAPPPADAVYCTSFVMPDPAKRLSTEPDARQQAPFEVGDYITYAGTSGLFGHDGMGPNGSDTISVHTIEANLGIFTQPQTTPVYLAIGEFGLSSDTAAATNAVSGVAQEAQNRIFLEAMTTDVTSIVDVYLVDKWPNDGHESSRWITPFEMTGLAKNVPTSANLPNPDGGGITTQFDGPALGRARIRATKATPGILVSPTRYVRVTARQVCKPSSLDASQGGSNACLNTGTVANGLPAGQYVAPVFEFIFPENGKAGDPVVPNDFWSMGFLLNGEGGGSPSSAGLDAQSAGPLSPTPW